MKSDLVGRVKHSELKSSTLYIDRRIGVVFLAGTNIEYTGMLATVVHTASSKYKLGSIHSLFGRPSLEVLAGKIELSNFQ